MLTQWEFLGRGPGSYRSRRTPQEKWDVRPNSPAAVRPYTGENNSRNNRLISIKTLLPTERNEVNDLSEKGETTILYMNMQWNDMFAVILSLYEYS